MISENLYMIAILCQQVLLIVLIILLIHPLYASILCEVFNIDFSYCLINIGCKP